MASYRQLVINDSRLASLPTSGSAWTALKADADGNGVLQRPINIYDNNLLVDNYAIANAIAYRKTGTSSYRDRALNACMDVIGREDTVTYSALPVCRHTAAFVIAADIAEMHTWDATKFNTFKSWCATMRTKPVGTDHRSITDITVDRANNWGAVAWTSRIALEIFTDSGGTNQPTTAAVNLLQGWIGDATKRSSAWPSGGSWYFGPEPIQWGIHQPATTTVHGRAGYELWGCIHEDMRRSGTGPGGSTAVISAYVWAVIGSIAWAAEMLRLRGYDVLNWSSQSMKKMFTWLKKYADDFGISTWYGDADNANGVWMGNYLYNLGYPAPATTPHKTSFCYCDYLFAGTITGGTPTAIYDSGQATVTIDPAESAYALTGLTTQIQTGGQATVTIDPAESTYFLEDAAVTAVSGTCVATITPTASSTLSTTTAITDTGTCTVTVTPHPTVARRIVSDPRLLLLEYLEGDTCTATISADSSGLLVTQPAVIITSGRATITITPTATIQLTDPDPVVQGTCLIDTAVSGVQALTALPDHHLDGLVTITIEPDQAAALFPGNVRPARAAGQIRATEILPGAFVHAGPAPRDTSWQSESAWGLSPANSDVLLETPFSNFQQPFTTADGIDASWDHTGQLDLTATDEAILTWPASDGFSLVDVTYTVQFDLWGQAVVVRLDGTGTWYPESVFRIGLLNPFTDDVIAISEEGSDIVAYAPPVEGGYQEAARQTIQGPIATGSLILRQDDQGIVYWEYRTAAGGPITTLYQETPRTYTGTLRFQFTIGNLAAAAGSSKIVESINV